MNEWLAPGIVLAVVLAVGGWVWNLATRIKGAEGAASEALKAAEQAKRDHQDISDKLAFQTAAFSLYREQIARDYIHREVMREVEDRLTAAIDRLGDRLDRVLERSDK